MKILINGIQKEINEKIFISELLLLFSIDSNNIVIELNDDIITKAEYDKITIKENDKLEIIRFVGGG